MLAGGRAITTGAGAGGQLKEPVREASRTPPAEPRPTRAQLRYLRRGLNQPGGKLPLFDESGAAISPRTIRSCVRQGWAKPWFRNPVKPDWLVCRLTEGGRAAAAAGED